MLRVQVGQGRAGKQEATGCRQLSGGLGNPPFFSGPRFPVRRVKLESFEGMAPETVRAARRALDCPHLFSGFGLAMLGHSCRVGGSRNPGPGLGPTRARRIGWEECLGYFRTSLG